MKQAHLKSEGPCQYCGRSDPKPKKAFCKTLDARLAEIAFEAFDHLVETQRKTFRTRDIWSNHHKRNDFQKLGYWDIFRRTKKGISWRLTEKGYKFLTNRIELPRRVWIRDWVENKAPVEVSDEMVKVSDLRPRWQSERSDFTLDYMRIKHVVDGQPSLI